MDCSMAHWRPISVDFGQKWPIFRFFNIPKLAHFFVLSFSFFNTYLWESLIAMSMQFFLQLFANFSNFWFIFCYFESSQDFFARIENFRFLIKIFNKLRWCVCVSIEEKESSIEVGFYAQARHLLHPFFSPPLSTTNNTA